tara:strand:+ start:43867 stop:44142 length:276 start_codon:yes stop_codon:yes gene_type:complete
MILPEKIKILDTYLAKSPENYRDEFKSDIYHFFNEDFTIDNPLLKFLDSYNDQNEIKDWVDHVTSQIVLKFDEEFEQIGDFIGEFIEMNKY